MNRQALRDYGLSIGIEFAELRDWTTGQTVMFMHEKVASPLFEDGSYKRGMSVIDKDDHWLVDDFDNFFWSVPLTDSDARALLVGWRDKNMDYRQYHDPAHLDWVNRARRRPIVEIDGNQPLG
jgi:hypothetical protein